MTVKIVVFPKLTSHEKGRGRPVAGAPPLSDGCKPDSVQLSARTGNLDGHLSRRRGSRAESGSLWNGDQYPEGSSAFAGDRAGDPVPPVLSCTAWGFSCPLACAWGGGLLPRLFTLARQLSPRGGLFSVTLSVSRGLRPSVPRVLRGMLP